MLGYCTLTVRLQFSQEADVSAEQTAICAEGRGDLYAWDPPFNQNVRMRTTCCFLKKHTRTRTHMICIENNLMGGSHIDGLDTEIAFSPPEVAHETDNLTHKNEDQQQKNKR